MTIYECRPSRVGQIGPGSYHPDAPVGQYRYRIEQRIGPQSMAWLFAKGATFNAVAEY